MTKSQSESRTYCPLDEAPMLIILTKISARKIIDNNDDPFWANLEKVYDGVFDQMPQDMHYQMFHMGYSRFFNTDPKSTWCNGQTFGKVGLSGLNPPKLTFDLRNKLNQLTDDWNSALHAHLLGYAFRKLNQDGSGKWDFQRIWFAQYDSTKQSQYSFAGHLFCEPGVEDSKFQDPSTWIFGVWGDQKDSTSEDANANNGVSNIGKANNDGSSDGVSNIGKANNVGSSAGEVDASNFVSIDAQTCKSDPKYNGDDAFGWDCDMAVYYADPTTDHSVTTITGLDFTRSFHPKSAGFTHIKEYLAIKMKAVRKAPQNNECIDAPPTNLDDDSAIASGFPQSVCANGAGALATALDGGSSQTIATATAAFPTSTAAFPTSTVSTPLGTCASKCNCNEDSCTNDSPTCCPNGTCDQTC